MRATGDTVSGEVLRSRTGSYQHQSPPSLSYYTLPHRPRGCGIERGGSESKGRYVQDIITVMSWHTIRERGHGTEY